MTTSGKSVWTAREVRDRTESMPAGTVTFLMTDIEGSTRLWEERREAMAAALEAHDTILRNAIEARGGSVVKTMGDGMLAAFSRPESAIAAAADGQRGLAHHAWGATGPLQVRMAVHTGTVDSRAGDFFGPPVNRVARLLAIGDGGQVLVSGAAGALAQDALPAGLELVDLGDHHLRDLDRPEHVFQLVGPDLRTDFPALRSLAAYRTNLSSQLTSLIGRERELGELRAFLSSHRLLTLTGTGGTGKTRLMLQVGAELLDRYADGVWAVELAAISDPGLVVREVARTLGVMEERGRDVLETLIDFTRSKSLLLLLDNCEHLLAAVADLVSRLLAACPTVTIMTSSREPLGIGGEVVFRVPSLTLPSQATGRDEHDARAGRWFEEAAASEAVQLFGDRATAVLQSFSLTADNAASVVEICRRLDGIPLAIELAAARVTVLSVDEIAVGLGDRFRLLTGGRRTALPRQQTLQALFDWSWDLLTESDRQLLARLSVFAGGWTLEAAAAVTTDPDSSETRDRRLDTLDGLSRLVDRSLVVVEQGATTRYRMLETIRQYGSERLIGAGEARDLRDRHLAFYLDLALQAEPAMRGPDLIPWLARLDAEKDNLRGALEWSFEADPERAIRLLLALSAYWRSRAFGSEALERLAKAADFVQRLPLPDPALEPAWAILVARVLAGTAEAHAAGGNAGPARAWAEQAVAIARATQDPETLAEALSALAMTAVFSGTILSMPELREEAVALIERTESWWLLSMLEGGAAMIDAASGDLAAAEARMLRATDAAEGTGNAFAIAFAALSRGRVGGIAGRLPEARHWFGVATAAYEAMGDRQFGLIARSDLAHALRRGGALDEAADLYRETLPEWQHLGRRGAIANQLEGFAFIALERGELVRAGRLFGATETMRELASAPMLEHERGEYDAALGRLREGLDAEALASAWSAGRQLTPDAAVSLALAADPEAPDSVPVTS